MHEDSAYQDEDLQIDVINFNRTADRTAPYHKIVIKDDFVHIYEGEVGADLFTYTAIATDSELGQQLNTFYDKQPLSTHVKKAVEIINDENAFHALFGDDDCVYVNELPKATTTGVEAFRLYWKRLNEQEKAKYDCFLIPDVESLMDWFNIALNNHLANIKHPIEYKELKRDEEGGWKRKLIHKINWVLADISFPFVTEQSRYISRFHARELLKFRGWVMKRDDFIIAQAAALFCSIVNISGIMQREAEESKTSYCDRVANEYNLSFPKNTRKFYFDYMDVVKSDPHLVKVMESIIPKLNSDINEPLLAFINNKILLSHKMSGL